MNITYLMAALLPSYIMLVALLIADAVVQWRDYLDTPVCDLIDQKDQFESRRGNVHAEMRKMRLEDDGSPNTQISDLHDGR